MNDPFDTKSVNRQLMREAKIGFAVVILLAGFFVYVGYFRMGSFRAQLPAHIVAAPIATNVGQDYYENFLPSENPGQPLADSPKASGSGNGALASKDSVPHDPQTETQLSIKNPFQLPSAIMKVGKQLENALADSDNTDEPLPQPGSTSELAPALRVADVTAGQGPIPASKLKSTNPNQQTEFDIATSGPAGQPEPFAGSDLRSLESNSSQGSADPGSPANPTGPPDARTARETSVNEKDQSRAEMPTHPGIPGRPEPMPLRSPFDNPNSESSIAKTETLSKRQVGPSNPAKPIPPAFTKPNPAGSAEAGTGPTPVPENHVSKETTGLSVIGEFEKHVVQTGDSYWSMAQTYLRDGRLFRALFEHNRSKDGTFEDLPTGTHIEIPTRDYLINHYPEHVPSDLKRQTLSQNRSPGDNWYLTQRGDTLFGIAKEEYGQASRYLDILDSNRDQLPTGVQHMTRLQGGLRLLLPD